MEVSEIVGSIKTRFPGRTKQIDLLMTLFGEPRDIPCQSIFVYGHAATGKSLVLKTLMDDLQLPHAWVNCVETYSQRLLLEAILKQLSATRDDSVGSCDNTCDFLRFLKQKRAPGEDSTFYVVLDNAERLRDLPPTVLAALFRLQELSHLNVCTVLVSEIIWEKFRCGIGYLEPYSIHFPEYTKDEIVQILQCDRPTQFSEEFYASYLKLLLSVFSLTTRDIRELRYIALSHFPKYCQPIQSGEASETDVRKLWRNIEPSLRKAVDSVYLREASGGSTPGCQISGRATVELPFYSKFLLLASYMASYNPATSDKKFFLKNQGQTRKKKSARKSNQPNQHLKGPKAFPLRRLLAIFYVIVDEKVAPSASLFSQISSLVTLRLLAISGDSLLTNPKYKCLVGLDFICNIARTVGFDITDYLYDFT